MPMTRVKTLWRGAALAALALPLLAGAQDRGRTDGPEGSEYGKGGYQRVGAGRFGLSAEFGGAFTDWGPLDGVRRGPPLTLGLTGAWWAEDYLLLEASAALLMDSSRVNLFVGPRLRTPTWPFSLSVALKAGPILDPDRGLTFGVSPQLGADMLLGNRVQLGLNYALDLGVGSGTRPANRVFMNLGYRF
jgi:hypothetical protein